MPSKNLKAPNICNGKVKNGKTILSHGKLGDQKFKKSVEPVPTSNGNTSSNLAGQAKTRSPGAERAMKKSKESIRNRIPQKIFLTPRQVQDLKSGPKINVFVGPVGDQFIAIEGAYKNILAHFSGRAKRDLTLYGVTRFNVPNTSKNIICWIYRFMLAGEKNPDKDKFEDFDIPYLILMYSHAKILEYKFLMDKTLKRLQYCISNVGLLDIETMKSLATFVPGLRKTLADSLAYTICERVIPSDWTPIHELHAIDEMGDFLDTAVQNRLDMLIARSYWYYGQLHKNCKPQPSKASHNATTTIARSRRQFRNNKKPATLPEEQAGVHSAEKQNPKNARRNGKGEFTQTTTIQDIDHHKPAEILDLASVTRDKISRSQRKARKSGNKSVNRTVESQSNNIEYTKLIGQTPLPHKQSTEPNCHHCGNKGHLSRKCPLQLPEYEQTYSTNPTRGTVVCYNCNESGHIARDCIRPSHKSERKPPNCYNCNGVGHIARNCSEHFASSTTHDRAEFVNTEYSNTLNGYGNNYAYNPSNARASVYAGRNRNRRRANAERYTDRFYELVESFRNGNDSDVRPQVQE